MSAAKGLIFYGVISNMVVVGLVNCDLLILLMG